MSSGFALNIRAECQHDFFGHCAVNAIQELLDAEIFRPYAFQRREPTAESVVVTAEDAGSFEGKNIRGALHNADESAVAFGIGADIAESGGRKKTALFAEPHLLPGPSQALLELDGRLTAANLDEVKGNALRAARSDTGEALERPD
jgi:hypothetical protein